MLNYCKRLWFSVFGYIYGWVYIILCIDICINIYWHKRLWFSVFGSIYGWVYIIMCIDICVNIYWHKVWSSTQKSKPSWIWWFVVVISWCLYLVGIDFLHMCVLTFKWKQNICSHLGGVASLLLRTWSSMVIFLQIRVLSSNTKKGEIERTFVFSSMFCVLDNNTCDNLIWC